MENQTNQASDHVHEPLLYKRTSDETKRETCACGATRDVTRSSTRVAWSIWTLGGVLAIVLALVACTSPTSDTVPEPDAGIEAPADAAVDATTPADAATCVYSQYGQSHCYDVMAQSTAYACEVGYQPSDVGTCFYLPGEKEPESGNWIICCCPAGDWPCE
jgi:hypothetical protein